MLSKSTYELVPYFCLLLGGSSIILIGNVLGIVAGAVLYSLGALIWIMRFNFRHPVRQNFICRGKALPELLYEFKPFFILAAVIAIVTLHLNTWLTAVAIAMVLSATYIFYQRITYRVRTFAEK